ncbi:hypothetical protein D3C72_2482810 [compost metagenome]
MSSCSGPPLSDVSISRIAPATATPSARLICCRTALIDVALLASASSISANDSALTLVKKNERAKPAISRMVIITR